jgi:DNA polymerase III subunit gamma/tau
VVDVSYQALYRVWRPQRFTDLVGQEHVTQTLKNALKEGHLSHAYLFNGPRGTGKTSAAKILAKAVNCIHGLKPEPCNQCEACQRITEGSVMDVVEIDAASNRGVDEIRDLRDKVKYAPTEVRYKVYIIDEVHMLTTEAFNALLKTLEEPPKHVIFVLATTEPHKLPATIISRCQRFSFRRISFENIVNRLKMICETQQIQFDENALFAVARAADGGMRDALSLLDQALAFGGQVLDEETVLAVTGSVSRNAIFELLNSLVQQDANAALTQLNDLFNQGLDAEKIMQDVTQACRDLLLLKTAPQSEEVQGIFAEEEVGKRLANHIAVHRLNDILDILIYYQQQMKIASNHRILLEIALVRLCHLPETSTVEQTESKQIQELKDRIEQLEQTVEQLLTASKQGNGMALASSDPIVGMNRSAVKKESPAVERHITVTNGDWLDKCSKEQLSKVRRAWTEILHRVKEERVTVHAWLIAGEPLAASHDFVVVGFKSKIHCDTTQRSDNKTLIEGVMQRVLGRPTQLKAIMMADWQRIAAKLNHEDVHGSTSSEGELPTLDKMPEKQEAEDDIVKRAIDLFGEELVEVSDLP